MTRDEIMQTAIAHWRAHYRREVAGWTEQQMLAQAGGIADLALMEMNALALIGVDAATAWPDVRNQMVMVPPPQL